MLSGELPGVLAGVLRLLAGVLLAGELPDDALPRDSEGIGYDMGEGVGLAVSEWDCVALWLRVGEMLGVCEGLAPTDRLEDGEAVAVLLALSVDDGVCRGVTVAEALGVGVALSEGVCEGVCEGVAEGVEDPLGVALGEAPLDRLLVGDNVTVLLPDSVALGVPEAVSVPLPEELGARTPAMLAAQAAWVAFFAQDAPLLFGEAERPLRRN
jgi:hypothetical protein